MRILLWLLPIGFFLVQGAFAQIYSCRDNQGKLYFSDRLSQLPPECLTADQGLDLQRATVLSVVPPASAPVPTSGEDEPRGGEAGQGEPQSQPQAEPLELRAQAVVSEYQDAVRNKNESFRSWRYGSRARVQEYDKEIQRARQQKQQLLEELAAARISPDQKKQIKAFLEQITD